jgi:HK97 family phage portal protein
MRDTSATPETFAGELGNPDNYKADVRPPSRAASVFSQSDALGMTAVFRSIQIISTVCSDLPLQTFRNGERIENPLVVNRPDVERPYINWVKRVVIDLALTGNAYLMKSKNARGETVNLRVLDPNQVTAKHDDKGRKWFDVVGSDQQTRTYNDDEVLHLRLLEIPGRIEGFGPIQAGRLGLIQAKNVTSFSSNWFEVGNGGVPLGVLSTDQELDGSDAQAYLDGWYTMLSQGSTAVLSKGLKYEPIALNPEDLQWLAIQKFNITEVSRLFGVPAPYLNAEVDASNFVYQNQDSINQVFYASTLRAYLSEIESAISEALPRGQSVRFDLSRLLKTDDRARYEAYNLAIAGGYMTPEYVAELEGLPKPPEPEPVPAQLQPQPDEEPEEEVVPDE